MQIDAIRERAAGFVAAQTGKPFLVPPVHVVGRTEMRDELRAMSDDLLEEKNAWSSITKPLENQVLQFLSGRIMGLYTQRYRSEHDSVVLLQGENITRLSGELGLSEEDTYLWILSHELFHGAQMDPALPLREHLQREVSEFLRTKKGLPDLRAAYTWIEGSADWLMDRPGLLDQNKIASARSALDARRQKTSWAALLLRLLGNKQAQYGEGRVLVEQATSRCGPGTLLLPAENPQLLPQGGEDADTWASRIEKACK